MIHQQQQQQELKNKKKCAVGRFEEREKQMENYFHFSFMREQLNM